MILHRDPSTLRCAAFMMLYCAKSANISLIFLCVPQASSVLATSNDKAQKQPGPADLFHIGQLVRGIIVGLDQQAKAGASNSKSGKKNIQLSLLVSKVNAGLTSEALQRNMPLPACVVSVEDHGYTLSFGMKGITGFLSKKSAGTDTGLQPGMLIECAAASSKQAKQSTVKVTASSSAVAVTVTEDYAGLSIGKTHIAHHGIQFACHQYVDIMLNATQSNAYPVF